MAWYSIGPQLILVPLNGPLCARNCGELKVISNFVLTTNLLGRNLLSPFYR